MFHIEYNVVQKSTSLKLKLVLRINPALLPSADYCDVMSVMLFLLVTDIPGPALSPPGAADTASSVRVTVSVPSGLTTLVSVKERVTAHISEESVYYQG